MSTLDQRSIDTIRMLAADAVQKANSGHPGMPMGAAPMAHVLWTRFLKHNPQNPDWPDRDRFILSAGHGSMLLYGLLHLCGYDLSLDDIKDFRQWGSKTPGHPEYGEVPGVEMTTGPLGQGFSAGVGMAIAENFLAAKFNTPEIKLVDHYVYSIVSDGDLMEGVSHEAASLAGHLGLGKLIYLYDDNHISIEGGTDLAFTENRGARFEAYGWHVVQVDDGENLEAIENAIIAAQLETTRPSLICVRTHIGFGSPNKQDKSSAHGAPLGEDELKLTKENLGWPLEPAFHVPDDVREAYSQVKTKGADSEADWNKKYEAYKKDNPEQALVWDTAISGGLPAGLDDAIPTYPADEKGLATRISSGEVLNAIAAKVPYIMGGSADLAPSNKTYIDGEDDFQKDNHGSRNIRFGVREHGMAAAMNGMALHGGMIPYGGTFLIFSDYMRPSIRLAALMGQKVIYVFTHDSIGLGEDGPTHQPVEQLAALRAIPNLTVIRPCDANETAQAWKFAVGHQGPTALALTRQNLPTLDREIYSSADNLTKGGYILKDAENGTPDAIIIATGSEIPLAIEAAEKLEQDGTKVRIVSMPSWELFEKQDAAYKSQVLPDTVTARVAVEAGCSQGWDRYIGSAGAMVGIDSFGASAPFQVLFEKFGITTENVIAKVKAVIKK